VPEYLAPGVFVEEVSFRAKSIEGVSTSTTGFVGPTRRGPAARPDAAGHPPATPEVLTSFLDFQRIYGGLEDLTFTSGTPAQRCNYLAHAVRAYFANGGARLYVGRVLGAGAAAAQSAEIVTGVRFVCRSLGACGNGWVEVSLHAEPATAAGLSRAPIGSIARTGGKPATPANPLTFYLRGADGAWKTGDTAMPAAATVDPLGVDIITLTVVTTDGDGVQKIYDQLGLDPAHPRYIGTVMSPTPTRRSDQLEQTFAVQLPATRPGALDLLAALYPPATAANTANRIRLTGGTDGGAPGTSDYAAALDVLQGIEDISIIAAPGSSADDTCRQGVHNELITHSEQRRAYRIAVLDSRQISTVGEARDDRAPLDSTRAALYAPWVIVDNPLYKTGDESRPREITLPPSGFVTGIYARTDVTRGVFKAPANEVVLGAIRHDLDINFAQQETLNPIGINCLRSFPNRGNRIWGARTVSSDPEWKYVNVRRYFNYLERSIDVGTQWVVFEPNGERLWANVKETISDFLVSEWRSGALLGSVKDAFFVRCDRSTMDQNDIDNGRLVCLIGVAVVKPAEFVIFRIGQKTVDARS
jgi:phage tail sheath protein FI